MTLLRKLDMTIKDNSVKCIKGYQLISIDYKMERRGEIYDERCFDGH